jgi:dihydrofolate reductase
VFTLKIITIVAVDNNWAIGKNNQLLYDIPTDMSFFRETTLNQIVVYGHKTLKSFPNENPLPKRTNIVLSHKDIGQENLIIAKSITELMNILNKFKDGNKDVFICGGASIYEQMIDLSDEAYVTKIDAITENADAYFPNLDKKENWEMIDETLTVTDEKSGLLLTFCTYINQNKQK